MESRFLGWLAGRGAVVHESVGLYDFSSIRQGRGAIALRDIPRDSVLFSLPRPPTARSPLLTVGTSALLSRLEEADRRRLSKGWNGLILSMMWEQARAQDPQLPPSESFGPYFDIMPQTFDTLMFWSEKELSELQASTVRDKIGREQAEEDFRDIVEPLIDNRPDVFRQPNGTAYTVPDGFYSLERYHQMGSLILSRSFHVDAVPRKADDAESSEDQEGEDGADEEGMSIDGASQASDDEDEESVADVAMVPMADILNAMSGKDNARLFYEPESLNMVATRPIRQGEQIYNTYADPPNADLLRRYGHVDLDNPFDVVECGLDFCLQALGAPTGSTERAEWAVENGLDDVFTIPIPTADKPLPADFVSALRVLLASADDFDKMREKEKVPKAKMDADVARAAATILEARSAQYPTTIEHDEEALAKAAPGSRLWQAILVRLGEKRILRDVLAMLKTSPKRQSRADREDKPKRAKR